MVFLAASTLRALSSHPWFSQSCMRRRDQEPAPLGGIFTSICGKSMRGRINLLASRLKSRHRTMAAASTAYTTPPGGPGARFLVFPPGVTGTLAGVATGVCFTPAGVAAIVAVGDGAAVAVGAGTAVGDAAAVGEGIGAGVARAVGSGRGVGTRVGVGDGDGDGLGVGVGVQPKRM